MQYYYGINPEITLYGQNTLQPYDRGFRGPATFNCAADAAVAAAQKKMAMQLGGASHGQHCHMGIIVVLVLLVLLMVLRR